MEQEPAEARTRGVRRDAQANRQQILATAKQLFAAEEPAAVTMQEIARAAQLGQGTLYRHFRHKGELCMALLHEDLADFQARVGPLLETPDAPLERLERLVGELVQLTESHLPIFAAMEQAPGEGGRPFRSRFGSWIHDQVERLLEQAATRGELAALDIPLAADVIQGAVAPPLYRYQREECGYSSERILASARQLIAALQRGAQPLASGAASSA